MRILVPEMICERYCEGRKEGRFNSFVLTADIAGFTSITESLSEKSGAGSEIISDAINRIFTPVIDIIDVYGGFVSSFAGDSFTSLFPENSVGVKEILDVSGRIITSLSETGEIKTKFGDFKFSVKVGLSRGSVFWRIIESRSWATFFFYGDPLKKSNDLVRNSSPGAVALDRALVDSCGLVALDAATAEDGIFYAKNAVSRIKKIASVDVKKKPFDLETAPMKRFFSENLLKTSVSGEFRGVIPCFIFVEENSVNDENIGKIIETASKYSGYFNKIDFGDKGWVILVVFGAPLGLENMAKRACNFALDTMDALGGKARIGMTSGTVYAGFIGSEKRSEYTVLGSVVNLAARISQVSGWGEISVDKSMIGDVCRYCTVVGERNEVLKGFEKNVIRVCSIDRGKTFSQGENFEGPFISRRDETERLKKILYPMFEKRFAGVVLVEGSAGVGKTRFLRHIKNIVLSESDVNWFSMNCDDLMANSFHPFTDFIRKFAERPEYCSDEEKISAFDMAYDSLKSELKDENARSDLEFGRVFFYALLGFEQGSQIYSLYDAKAVYDNTLNSLRNFFRSYASIKPLVIEIEDTNWIDTDSLKLLNYIIADAEFTPLCVLLSYRIVAGKTVPPYEILSEKIYKISLNSFGREDSHAYISGRLKELSGNENSVPDYVVEKIIDITEGNPLFMEQILLFLKNKGSLSTESSLDTEEIEFPSNINSLIISRLDLLKFKLKGLIKAASVLGKDFETLVLSKVTELGDISPFLEEGENEAIWAPLSASFYAFLHAMIRECVYRMQLKKDLKSLHEKAGETIEIVYSSDLEDRFEELSYHFEHAENEAKRLYYLYKSAEKLSSKYRYSDASVYYGKLVTSVAFSGDNAILSDEINDEKAEEIDRKMKLVDADLKFESVLIRAAEIERFLGNWQKAEQYYRFALSLSSKKGDSHSHSLALRNLGRHLLNKGEYNEAQKILKEAEKYFLDNHCDKELAQVYGDLGFLMTSQGDYAGALEYYESQRIIYERISDERGLSQVMLDQGVVFWRQGFMDKAMQAFEKQLEMAQRIQDKRLYARAVGNMGLAFAMQGKYEKAKECLEENLKVVKELGDRVELSKTYGNLGVLNKDTGNLTEAERLYNLKLSVAKELGDKAETQQVTANIGLLKMQLGELKTARKYFKDSLSMANSLMDEKGKAFILRSMGQLYYQKGNYIEAIGYFKKSKDISEAIGEQIGVFSSLGNIGIAYIDMGQNKKALKFLEEQLREAKKTGVQWNLMYAMINLGIVSVKTGEIDLALKYLKKAENIASELKHGKFVKDIHLLQADAEISRGRLKPASRIVNCILELSDKDEADITAQVLLSKITRLKKSSPSEKKNSIYRLALLSDREMTLKNRADILHEMAKTYSSIVKTGEAVLLAKDKEFLESIKTIASAKKTDGSAENNPEKVDKFLYSSAQRHLKELIKIRPTRDHIKRSMEIKRFLERKNNAVGKKK
ncbi:tetratricopeptide repeat protein [candidate division WOR-3 bacterium]|nr:tetratricopeptide repeat protein [candidate division WOR-3 bacterium]